MRNFFMVYVLNTETQRLWDAGFVYKEEKLCAFESLCSMYSAVQTSKLMKLVSPFSTACDYSTVTDFARFRGWSTFLPLHTAM